MARPRPAAPALPPNHPTLKPGDPGALMGVAALQAAPKVAPTGMLKNKSSVRRNRTKMAGRRARTGTERQGEGSK